MNAQKLKLHAESAGTGLGGTGLVGASLLAISDGTGTQRSNRGQGRSYRSLIDVGPHSVKARHHA